MSFRTYEIPDSIKELFEQGETSYRIIDYDPTMEMDNIQSMQHFCEVVGISNDFIETNDGTQIVLKHPDFENKLVVDSGGLGDFFSHGFDVSKYDGE